jgi:Tfp pilus assembly protein PilZ
MKRKIITVIIALAFLGFSIGAEQQLYAQATKTVWITPTGKKYHRERCRTVKGEKQEITLQEALERDYEPCKVCNPR